MKSIKKQRSIYYQKNKEKIKQKSREYYKSHAQERKTYAKNYRIKNKKEINVHTRRKHQIDPRYSLISASKRSAKSKGMEHNLVIEDIIIPEKCPILKIPLFVGNGQRIDNSPSLDRIDNLKGYTKENVIVVSWRANNIKSDASITELQKIVDFYSRKEQNNV